MRLVRTTGKTWYKVLYKHTMYVISLSNISLKTNLKQITRVELRLTNFYITLRETKSCAWRHVSCCHSPKSRHCWITFSVITIVRQCFIFLNMDRNVAGNIETMSLEMRI